MTSESASVGARYLRVKTQVTGRNVEQDNAPTAVHATGPGWEQRLRHSPIVTPGTQSRTEIIVGIPIATVGQSCGPLYASEWHKVHG